MRLSEIFLFTGWTIVG